MRTVMKLLLAAMLSAAAAAAQGRPNALPPQQVAQVHGLDIRYFDVGEKTAPVVLLLHGMGDRAANHMGTAGILAKHFRVIVPDQIGYGASDKPAITYRIRTFSDFNKGLLDALGVKHAYIAGESLGGWIAADMALRFPDIFERVVLIDSAGVQTADHPFSTKDIADDLYVSSIFDMRKMLERLYFHKEAVTDRMVEAAFREHLKSGVAPVTASFLAGMENGGEWLNDRAAGIKAPTLILWCKHDELLSPTGADVLQKKIAGSRKVMLDGCGHIPEENWQVFHDALTSFLLER